MTTNAEGRAVFTAETAESLEGESVVITAQLPENEGLTNSASVLVALSALDVSISTEESVVLAGETFNARVRVAATTGGSAVERSDGNDGNAAPRSVRIVGVRRYAKRGGRFGEDVFLDRAFTTGADGKLLVPIEVSQGGGVELRAIAVDRLGREVEGQCHLQVSGDDDSQRLRVLSSDTSLLVGDEGVVRVVDRSESGGLALMTIEANTVLEHRVIDLQPGVTELRFDASTAHVPDIQISVAAIRETHFRSGSATFRVQRPLRVTVESASGSLSVARRGEAREIVIKTTDGRGTPVAAEVAVALVDEALLRAFPGRTETLSQTFAIQGSRTPSFLGGASAGFTYEGITSEIDEAILEEGRRADARAETDRMRDSVGLSLEELDEEMLESTLGGPAFSVVAKSAARGPAMGDSSMLAMPDAAGGRRRGRMNKKPARPQATPEVDLGSPTAFWRANLETDADGVARVTLPLPELNTTWQLDVAAASLEHRFGEAKEIIVVSSPLVAVIDAPTYVSEGDAPRLRAEITLDAPAEKETSVELELRVSGLADEGEEPRQSVQRATVTIPKSASRAAHAFDALAPIGSVGGLEVELSASAPGMANATASARRGVLVRPRGYHVADSKAGRLTQETKVRLELGSSQVDGDSLDLTLIAGATEAAWIVRAALEGDASRDRLMRARSGSALAMASQLHGVAELLDAAARSGGLNPASTAGLRTRASGLVGALAGRAEEDGGWERDSGVWRTSSTRASSDPRTTARAIVALALAQRVGVGVPSTTLEKAIRFATGALSSADSDDERAHLAWALEVAGPGADIALGRLHRERASLGQGALCALALALDAADRGPMAREVAELIEVDPAAIEAGARRGIGSRLERAALAALARTRAKVGDAAAHRSALLALAPWHEPVGRGAAVAACAVAGVLAEGSAAGP
ncbi:MAG: alpha-2-macroglobulin family protein, partial [Planctomycetota bacterium]